MLLLCVSMIMRLDLDGKDGQNFNASKYGDGWRCGDEQYRDVYVVMHYWPASWLGEAHAFRLFFLGHILFVCICGPFVQQVQDLQMFRGPELSFGLVSQHPTAISVGDSPCSAAG